jgi:hypothetical protein
MALRRNAPGQDHSDTQGTMDSLAYYYMDARKYAQAEPLYAGLLALARDSADTKPDELDSRLANMAELRYRQQRYAEAEPLFLERIKSRLRRPDGETSSAVLHSRSSLGRLYADWAWAERATNSAAAHERAVKGENLIRDLIAIREKDPAYMAWRKADLQSRLGGALISVAFTDPALTFATREPKLQEAEAALQRGQTGMEQEKKEEVDAKYLRDGLERFVRLYEAWPKPDKLAEWKQKLSAFDEAEDRKNNAAPP